MWLSRTMVAPPSKSRGIPLPGVVYSRFCICSEYLRVLPSSPQQSSPKTVGPPGTSVASKMHNLNIPEGCRSCSDLLCDQNHWIYKQFQRYRSSLIHCRLYQVMASSHAYLKYEDHSHRCSQISAPNWERSLCTTGPAPPLPALGITCDHCQLPPSGGFSVGLHRLHEAQAALLDLRLLLRQGLFRLLQQN